MVYSTILAMGSKTFRRNQWKLYMVDVNQWDVSRSNQKVEEAELHVVSAPGLFFIIFV